MLAIPVILDGAGLVDKGPGVVTRYGVTETPRTIWPIAQALLQVGVDQSAQEHLEIRALPVLPAPPLLGWVLHFLEAPQVMGALVEPQVVAATQAVEARLFGGFKEALVGEAADQPFAVQRELLAGVRAHSVTL